MVNGDRERRLSTTSSLCFPGVEAAGLLILLDERGIAWDDPSLGIDWRVSPTKLILSDRDRRNPRLADVEPSFLYKRRDL